MGSPVSTGSVYSILVCLSILAVILSGDSSRSGTVLRRFSSLTCLPVRHAPVTRRSRSGTFSSVVIVHGVPFPLLILSRVLPFFRFLLDQGLLFHDCRVTCAALYLFLGLIPRRSAHSSYSSSLGFFMGFVGCSY